jgi:[ribosomal protein S5]-alanine N-acetyltransferase
VILQLGDYQIRSLQQDDRDTIVKYANNKKISANLRDGFPFPYTIADATSWLDEVLHQKPETHFAIATLHELIGGIGLSIQSDVSHRSAELGYWIGEPYWGKGIATAAVRSLTAWGFRRLDLLRIYANVFESNPASARVLEKAGFILEGRMRKHVTKEERVMDMLLYAAVTEDFPAS